MTLTYLKRKVLIWSVFHYLSSPFLTEARVHDSPTDKSYEQGEDPPQSVHQQLEIQKRTSALLLDSLKNAAIHLRRAMVPYTHAQIYTHTQIHKW